MAVAVIIVRGVLALLVLAASAAPAAAAAPQLEYDVKGQFLGHFIGFIQWPASAFASAEADFRICIVGRDPFGRGLRTSLAAERAGSRRIVVDTLKDDSTVPSCQIVFLAEATPARAAALHKATRGRPILIVSDSIRLLEHCAAIAFVIEGSFVRFDINLAALKAHGLQVNPRLLRVARDATDRFGDCD
jgi:hypothetical protein